MASGQCMCKVSKIVLGDLKRKEKSVYDYENTILLWIIKKNDQ